MGMNSEGVNESVGDSPLPHERALRDAMWRGHGGFEIAISPVLLGLIGYVADERFGTTPLFIVVGAILGLVGAIANQYYRYVARMDELAAERAATGEETTSTLAPSFARVEHSEALDGPGYATATEAS